MGCAGSTNMVPATSDISVKPANTSASNSILPKGELVLKDLPDVVEKVIDSLKESDTKNLKVDSNQSESSKLPDVKEVASTIIDKSDVNNFQDRNKKYSTQGVVQGALTDNASSSSSSKQSELEHIEEIIKPKNKNSPTISAGDKDSLRTSSPESEIEEALANNNDQNPPTPKPTFSELQNLVVGPVNTMIKSYVKTTENIFIQAGDKIPATDSSDKSEQNTTTNRKDLTEWEKQADILALTQKYNPIEAMRKFKRDNGSDRTSSALILKHEFKPKIQNYFEDLNEFLPLQSPHRSTLSSAKSERSVKVIPTELDDIERSSKNENEDNKSHKAKGTKLKKTPDRKIKDSFLIVPTNVRGVPSPSPHKVRERCAVCCNKYKH